MTYFAISDEGRALNTTYPSPSAFAAALSAASRTERDAIVRLWLTEGIPSAFQDVPLVYEAARASFASDLGVDEKEVTLVGSARIGYSLAPFPEFGRSFSPSSDLDFSVISTSLFAQLAEAFATWNRDYNSGTIKPTYPREQIFWPENLSRLPGNLKTGFIDHYKIPYRYEAPRRVNECLLRLKYRLDQDDAAPSVRQVSVRVFRDWQALLKQASINLRRTANSFIQPLSS